MHRFLACSPLVGAGPAWTEPQRHWAAPSQPEPGWSAEKLEAACQLAASGGFTGIMVVQDDRVVASWGDVSRPVHVHSVRKSLLSSLIGIAVDQGRIKLSSTMAKLGVDDTAPALTPEERQATVRDLLMARSGVYHLSAGETPPMRAARPPRGSHPPGSFWYYNNWDFNVLGTIYREQTGQDIYTSFADQIARPLGMEDFNPANGHYVLEPDSIHPVYTFRLSARDAARFGLLFLQRGRWNSRQIVPAAWVAEATKPWSSTDQGALGYGYLWWTLPEALGGRNGFAAQGVGGQTIVVMPDFHLVIVRMIDAKDLKPRRQRVKLEKLVEAILAARQEP